MYKKVTFLFIFFVQIIQSQTYTFDKIATYKSSDNFTNSVYCNSNDSNYFMRVLNSYQKQEAIVYDIKNMKKHIFEITTDNLSNDSNTLTFIYNHSSKIQDIFNNNNHFEYVKINEDSTYVYSKIIAFKNKSKKKVIEQIELKIKKDKTNYFPLYRFSAMHTLEYNSELNFNIGGIIESSRNINSNFQYHLIEFQDFNIELIVEKEKL